MHIVIVVVVALAVLFAGFIVGMLVTVERADESIAEMDEYCTRSYPHVCRVNGPCNGWPQQSITKENR